MRDLDKLGLAGIVIAIGYAGFVHYKMHKINNIIEETIDEVTDTIHVDIAPTIIKEATDRAIDREVNQAIRTVSYEVTQKIRKDMQMEVRLAVSETYSNTRKSVSDEVAKQVSKLDINLLQADVKKKATQLVMDKFQADLDSLLQDFNDNLKNVSKIYESIAESMSNKK